jgi:Zn-dependent protease with chaperone function
MTSEQFDRLVDRIQTKYRNHPWALRGRIALLVGLGYAGFLAGILLVLIVALLLTVVAIVTQEAPGVVLIGFVALMLPLGIWQALIFLWVPMEAETARTITRQEAPQLFDLLDRLQFDLGASPFDHVQIDARFNAAVHMIPRLGVFGFNRSHLYLGLPMMQALSSDQFASVLAHEFAHSSSRHDRFSAWIYRLRSTWARLFEQFRAPSTTGLSGVIRKIAYWFVEWYWPRFNAYAFVLSRMDEYQADRIAAEWAGSEITGETLVKIVCLLNRIDDQFVTELNELSKSTDLVPDDMTIRLGALLASHPAPDDARRWLDQAARTLTGNIDTHPSLSDRLGALGLTVDQFVRSGFPTLASRSAAQTLLGAALSEITRDVNRNWQKENAPRWHHNFQQARRVQKQQQRMKSADPEADASIRSTTDRPNIDELWKQITLACELHGIAAAEPLIRRLLDQRPAHGPANLTLGRHLLERGNAEGETYVRRVLDQEDSEWIPAACQVLIEHFQKSGQKEQVRETLALISRHESLQQAAHLERSSVTDADRFVDHGLTDSERDGLVATLSQDPQLESAWLVRKVLKHFTNQRLFVLVVRSPVRGWFGASNSEEDRALVTRLKDKITLPGRVLVIAPQGGFRKLARKIMKTQGTPLYPANPLP